MATKIDLKPFCDTDPIGRLDMSKPFIVDGFRYATDGRICVRVPTIESNSKPPMVGKYPRSPGDVFQNFPTDGFAPLVRGKQYQDLEVSERCRYCRHCGECGRRLDYQDCAWCDDTGDMPREMAMVGNQLFGEAYLRKIEAIPDVQVCEIGDMLAFRFDGGQGLLMHIDSCALDNAREVSPCPTP